MKSLAFSLMDSLTIKKNTNKYNYFKMKEIKGIIDHINNIKVTILIVDLLLLVLSVAFDLYYFAIILSIMVIIAYFGLGIYQKVMGHKITH